MQIGVGLLFSCGLLTRRVSRIRANLKMPYQQGCMQEEEQGSSQRGCFSAKEKGLGLKVIQFHEAARFAKLRMCLPDRLPMRRPQRRQICRSKRLRCARRRKREWHPLRNPPWSTMPPSLKLPSLPLPLPARRPAQQSLSSQQVLHARWRPSSSRPLPEAVLCCRAQCAPSTIQQSLHAHGRGREVRASATPPPTQLLLLGPPVRRPSGTRQPN